MAGARVGRILVETYREIVIRHTLMTIRAVIFDVGGVLSHHKDLTPLNPWQNRLNMSAEQILHTVFGNDVAKRATLGQATVAEIWQYANRQFGLSETDQRALIADFWATMTWDHALLDFIRTLKLTFKTGALSDAWPDARISNAPITGDLFDVIVYSAEEGIQKPNPEIYRRTLARLDVLPTESIYVDDSPAKVEAAGALGMHALLFTGSQAIREQITRLLADQG
jgi:epoxide hydrolase-like predicted phosphatase